MLKLGIDVSPLELTRAGTARYLASLLEALEGARVDVHKYVMAGEGRVRKVVRDTAWYLAGLPRAARKDGVDVLHCPTQRAPFRTHMPLVVTIHDIAVLRHPQAFNRWTRSYSSFALPRVARAANAIIVGSDFAKNEVLDQLALPESKVRVIPYGVGPPFTADGARADGDYILAVSSVEPRKNLGRLVEGFRRAQLDGLELRLVGAESWGDVSVEGERVRRMSGVGDDELARLYRGAAAVAYVSLYEGFGLPVLEAMSCGRPVVAPAGPPYSEFAAGIAFEVDPRDPDSIAEGLQKAVAAGSQPVGARRAADFTWERAVASHLGLYQELAG